MLKSTYKNLLDEIIILLSTARDDLDNDENESEEEVSLTQIICSFLHFVEQKNEDDFKLDNDERKRVGLHIQLMFGLIAKLGSFESSESSIEKQFLSAFTEVDLFPELIVKRILDTCDIDSAHLEKFSLVLNSASGRLMSREGLYASTRKFPIEHRNNIRDFENKIPKFQLALSKILPLYQQISFGAAIGSKVSSSQNAEKINQQYHRLVATAENLEHLSTIYTILADVVLSEMCDKRKRGAIEDKPIKLWAEEILSSISELRGIPITEMTLSRDAKIFVGLQLALEHLHYPVNAEKAYGLAKEIRAKYKN